MSPRRILISDACVDRLTADDDMRFSSPEQHRAGGRSGLDGEGSNVSPYPYFTDAQFSPKEKALGCGDASVDEASVSSET